MTNGRTAPVRDKQDDMAKIHTIFHKGRTPDEVGVLVLAGSNLKEIRHDYVQFGTPGFPIHMLTFMDVGRLFGASPIQFWLDLHDAFNEFIAEGTERAMQVKTIIAVRDEESRDKIAAADGNAIIVSPNPDGAFHTEKVGGMAPETMQMAGLYSQAADKIMGMGDPQRGVIQSGDQTATEINTVTQFAQTRVGDLIEAGSRFLRKTAIDSAGMLLAHQWQQVPVKLDLGGGESEFSTFDNQSVPRELSAYDFDFDIATHARMNPALRQKRAQEPAGIAGRSEFAELRPARGLSDFGDGGGQGRTGSVRRAGHFPISQENAAPARPATDRRPAGAAGDAGKPGDGAVGPDGPGRSGERQPFGPCPNPSAGARRRGTPGRALRLSANDRAASAGPTAATRTGPASASQAEAGWQAQRDADPRDGGSGWGGVTMPIYDFKCSCGKAKAVRRPISQWSKRCRCKCGKMMVRDFTFLNVSAARDFNSSDYERNVQERQTGRRVNRHCLSQSSAQVPGIPKVRYNGKTYAAFQNMKHRADVLEKAGMPRDLD